MSAFHRASQLQVVDVYRRTLFEVLMLMVDQAAAVVSAREFDQLVADSAASLALQQARADKGDTAGLDVDRLSVEHQRLISARDEHLIAQQAALSACASMGGGCPRFASADEAAPYLERGLVARPNVSDDWKQARPDLKSLQAQGEAAQALETLGRRRGIPDPTITVGYTKDRFVVAGNQAQSLTLSVSLPIPLFERGQVSVRTAAAQRQISLDQAAALTRSGSSQQVHLLSQLQLARHRAEHLSSQVLPRAEDVLARLQAAAARGGVPLQEVLLARRTLEDLRLERVQVVAQVNHLWLEHRLLASDLPLLDGTTAAAKKSLGST